MLAFNGLRFPQASDLVQMPGLANRLRHGWRADHRRRLVTTSRDIDRTDMLLAAAFVLMALEGIDAGSDDLADIAARLGDGVVPDIEALSALVVANGSDESSAIDRLLFDAATGSKSVNGFTFAEAPQSSSQGLQIATPALVLNSPLDIDPAHATLALQSHTFDFSSLTAQSVAAPYLLPEPSRTVAEEAVVAMAASDTFLLAEDYDSVPASRGAYDPIDAGYAGPVEPHGALIDDPVLMGEIAAFAPADADAFGAADASGGNAATSLAMQDFAFNDLLV